MINLILMDRSPEKTIYDWLLKLKIPVSFNYVKSKLCSHFDYPSLLSVTDTLDVMGIDNTTMVIDKERLSEMPVPFLAYAYKGESFTIINDTIKFQKASSEELKNWNGVIIAAEKPQIWKNSENDNLLNKERKNTIALNWAGGIFLLLSFYLQLSHFSWVSLALLLSSFAGLFVAVLIVMHELGFQNAVADQLCRTGKNADCDAIMKSKGSELPFGFKWSDAGIIYFSAESLALIIAALNNEMIALSVFFSIVSVLSLPFTFYSLYYQKKIVRKWCMLCLLTVSILWLQFSVLSSSFFSGVFSHVSMHSFEVTVFSFFCTAVLWFLLLKPALDDKKELQQKNFKLQRFKNDPEIFETLLKQQDKADITAFGGDLQLGNPDAPIQVMVACNPYCPPCAKAHKELDDLLEQSNLGLTVRFAINADVPEDDRTKAVEYILRCVTSGETSATHKRKIIHDWYDSMDLEKFSAIHSVSKEPTGTELLKRHDRWSKDAKIQATPTIFINGFKMPNQYQVGDLQLIIDKWESYSEATNTKINYKSPEGLNSLFAQTG